MAFLRHPNHINRSKDQKITTKRPTEQQLPVYEHVVPSVHIVTQNWTRIRTSFLSSQTDVVVYQLLFLCFEYPSIGLWQVVCPWMHIFVERIESHTRLLQRNSWLFSSISGICMWILACGIATERNFWLDEGWDDRSTAWLLSVLSVRGS